MISGHTRLAAVLATPIKHSISPLIHNTGFQALNIDAVYLAFEVGADGLASAFETIRQFDMLGVNLSMPNKQPGFHLVDEVSPAAQLLGSINTVVNHGGRLCGHNTDGAGFMASLKEEGVAVVGKKMTMLGIGGAALAIIAQAALDGVSEISIFARQLSEKVDEQRAIQGITAQTSCRIQLFSLENEADLVQELSTSDILVNSTNVGMAPNCQGNLIAQASWLKPELVVADIIYEPKETALLKMARQQGCQTINGLGMLIHQGAIAFELWTGQVLPLAAVNEAVKKQTNNTEDDVK